MRQEVEFEDRSMGKGIFFFGGEGSWPVNLST